MWLIRLLILLSAAAVAGAALRRLRRVVQARNRRRLWRSMPGTLCDSLDGAGISLLVGGISEAAQVAALLEVEYARYEVVAALDAQRSPALFRELVARYRMIAVNYRPCGELPAAAVRTLYRSRTRCYRRLVLLDAAAGTPESDFDAAAGAASYDYLLPLDGRLRLKPRAVERLAAELGDAPRREIEALRTCAGARLLVVARDRVAASGGFSRLKWRGIARHRRRDLYEALAVDPAVPERAALWRAGYLLAAAGFAAAACAGWWTVAAVAATAAAAIGAERCIAGILRAE